MTGSELQAKLSRLAPEDLSRPVSDRKVFVDMDGVIADFVGGVIAAHKRSVYDDPAHYGKFDIEKIWGIKVEEFWEPLDSYEFWRGLAKTPEADRIVYIVTKKFGAENVAILTAPSESRFCVPGKRDWIAEHYPVFKNRMIFGSAKEFLAGPDRVLIDDRDKNAEVFEAAGGVSVLVPRLWNKRHPWARLASEVVYKEVAEIT